MSKLSVSTLSDIAGGIYGEETTVGIKSIAAKIDKLTEDRKVLRDALARQTEAWCDLVNSGDAGKWDPESDDFVIASRAALECTK
jgi:hypothetical protein